MTRKGDFFNQFRKVTHLVALVALVGTCVLFFFLGKWQWDRTQNILNAERAASGQAVSVADIASESLLAEDFGRSVTAEGQYELRNQVRVSNRLENGRSDAQIGEWVVSEFAVDSGIRIAVLRGWVPPGGEFATPIEPVVIEGVIQPNEVFYDGAVAGQTGVVVIDSVELSEIWDSELVSGFIVLKSQDPKGALNPIPVPPTIATADVAFPLQNFFYAIQWWVFALFSVALYGRWILVSAREQAQT